MEDVSGYELGCGLSGTTENGNDYIFGGEKVDGNPYPWIARIYGGCAGYCAGTLITKRHLLTAYHCTYDIEKSRTKLPCDHSDEKRVAVFGRNKFNRWNLASYYNIPITKVLYPRGAPIRLNVISSHDFAMVVLKYDVSFSKHVRPICLPKKGDWFYGKMGITAGWGRYTTDKSKSQSPFLRKAKLRISNKRYNLYKMFGTKLETADPCSGDSGGPLMYRDKISGRYVIIGTVFGGGFNCRKNEIMTIDGSTNGVWNMVSYHADWIKRQIRKKK